MAPQSRQTWSSKTPRAAPEVRPSEIRLRGAGGSIGARVRRTGFLRFGFLSGAATAQSPAARIAAAEQTPRS